MLQKKWTFVLCYLISFSSFAQSDSLIGKVYFDFDRFEIHPVAANTLQQLVANNKNISEIILVGRTDIRGNLIYNDSLAARRILAVENYLLEQGFSSSQFSQRIILGKRNPIAEDVLNLASRNQLNRVVEIRGKLPATTVKNSPPPKALQEQIKEGKANIILQNLNFEGGRHILLPGSGNVLNEVLEVMKNNPSLEVEIRGHICCAPVNEDGLDIDTGEKLLSRNRAREIYQYLINNGITSSRLSFKGMGASQKIVPEEVTEKDREINRRVEFVIIKR
ncbi:MAG: OmpA family protein [Chitinophagia bacterium]|jgi:outer membrane protein OmpA-like peptidoglycan-associated protein